MTEELSAAALLEAALSTLARTERLLVCCDFDGTISEIAEHPSAAKPVDGAVAALDSLAALPDTYAAVVSGRALIDLSRLSGMPDRVHLVGSHGSEFEVGAMVAINPADSVLLDTVRALCSGLAHGVPGVLIEEKPSSIAVHVRLADPQEGAAVLDAVRAGPGSLAGVHMIEGKAVVELAVFEARKADGVRALRDRWDITGTLFVGDDVTDESAFGALGGSDMAIKVGAGATIAPWRVLDPHAVVEVLRRLALLRAATA